MNISALILEETAAMGPFLRSGGVIHKVEPPAAEQIAEQIARAHDAWKVPVALMCAIIRGESRFDPDCFDPNLEDAPNHAWPDQHTQDAHTDFGLCQVNGDSTYLGMANVGRSLEYLCQALISDIMWGALLAYPPEVALQSYNQGKTGAAATFKAGGVKACSYGRLVMARYEDYVTRGLV